MARVCTTKQDGVTNPKIANFIISLLLECNLAHNFDNQRFLSIMGVVAEFRSLGAFLVDLVEDGVFK